MTQQPKGCNDAGDWDAYMRAKADATVAERVTCECGWNVFPGEQWPWEDGDGCASYRHCHDCGQELVIDDNGNPILGPTREERDRADRALAILERLSALHRSGAMTPAREWDEHEALCAEDPIAALEAMMMRTDMPRFQVTRIAPDGRTIEPLALALTAGTRVFVATQDAIDELADDDMTACEHCSELLPFAQTTEAGEDGPRLCGECLRELVAEDDAATVAGEGDGNE